MRFCQRQDVDPASLGYCSIEELPTTRAAPSPRDILVVAKRYMADPMPFKVVTLVSAAQATNIRLGFRLPIGLAERRAIPTQVQKNIKTYCDRAYHQGVINTDARAYLNGWVAGSLPKIPKPTRYSVFDYRQPGVIDEPQCFALPWVVPARARHVNLDPGRDPEIDSSDDDEDDGDHVAALFALPGQ